MSRGQVARRDFAAQYGPWALVTGASSGIGREFARRLAERQLNVALVARRAERLEALAAALAADYGVTARPIAVDLCRDDFLDVIGAATDGLSIGLLVNSAGFSLTGPFLDADPADLTRMLHLNCRAPLQLTRAFGPAMRRRRRGGIIMLSSVVAFVGTPLWSAYSATKGFDLLLGEALAAELRADGVHVLTLAPGTTRTEFLDVAGLDDFMSLAPERVVADALRALGHADIVVPGWFYRGGTLAMRFLPRAVNRAVFGRLLAAMRTEE